MGMLSHVLGSNVTSVKKRSWSELHSFFDTVTGYSTDEKNTTAQQLAEYRSWVQIATNVIYRRFSEIDWKYFRIDTDEEVKKKNRIYPAINKIFVDPNPFMEFRFLKQYTQLALDLTGHAFILREDDPVFGLPYRLWPLMVTNFRGIIKGKTFRDWILGFRFLVGDEEVVFSPDNILYFRYPSPKDPRDGWSPIRSQAYAIDVDHYIEVYERDFFKHSARPDIALSYPAEVVIEESDAKRIIADWKKKFGNENFHQLAILDQGASIQKLTAQNEDLALSWLAGWSQDKILSCYTVPKGKVGIMTEINKSSAQSIEETFNRECILPRLRLFDEVVTRGVLQRFDERLSMRHSNPVPKDQEVLLKEAKEKTGVPTRTINEQREIDSQKGVGAAGDRIYVPLNFVPLGGGSPTRVEEEEE